MNIAALLDPIDPGALVTDGVIRISNSAVTILLFLFAQTVGAVWWASAMNEKMNQFGNNLGAQATSVATQRNADLERIKLIEQRLEYLFTYNQRTREQLAANGWILDEQGNLKRKGR